MSRDPLSRSRRRRFLTSRLVQGFLEQSTAPRSRPISHSGDVLNLKYLSDDAKMLSCRAIQGQSSLRYFVTVEQLKVLKPTRTIKYELLTPRDTHIARGRVADAFEGQNSGSDKPSLRVERLVGKISLSLGH